LTISERIINHFLTVRARIKIVFFEDKKFNANGHENDQGALKRSSRKAEPLWNELLKKITVFKTVENVRLFFSVVQVK